MKFKKLASLFLACAMVAGMSVISIADKIAYDTQLEPRAIPCDRCGSGFLFSHIEYDNWIKAIFQACVHGYPKGTDTIERRNVFEIWECGSCNFSDKTIIYKESRTLCHGHDRSIQENA